MHFLKLTSPAGVNDSRRVDRFISLARNRLSISDIARDYSDCRVEFSSGSRETSSFDHKYENAHIL
jgi:hypothetical protein